MKNFFKKFKESGLLIFGIMLLCSFLGVYDGSAMTADVVAGEGGGAVEHGTVTTLEFTDENSQDLISKTIDREVVKIKPHRYALDTLARSIKDKRHSNNPIVQYYSVSSLPPSTSVKTTYTAPTNGDAQAAIDFAENAIIAVNETIIIPSVPGYKEDGSSLDGTFLVLNVVDRDASGKPICVPLNGPTKGTGKNTIPNLPAGTMIICGGRAASELQIRTDIYNVVPTPKEQYLQKHIIEIEESTYMEMSDKEVKWNFSDLTEQAIDNFRDRQNTSFWIGTKQKKKIKNKYNRKLEETYFSEGIWWQAGKDFSFGGQPITAQNLVSLMKNAFVGNASSSTKILLGGSDFIEALEQVEYNQVVHVGSKKQKAGLEFDSIISKFGTLLVYHDQSLNDIGFSGKAFILDVDYLTKWGEGWRAIPLDHIKTGESDSKGQVFIETCGLTLKNADAHTRVSLA